MWCSDKKTEAQQYLLQARMFFVTKWHPVLVFLSQPWWQDQMGRDVCKQGNDIK